MIREETFLSTPPYSGLDVFARQLDKLHFPLPFIDAEHGSQSINLLRFLLHAFCHFPSVIPGNFQRVRIRIKLRLHSLILPARRKKRGFILLKCRK